MKLWKVRFILDNGVDYINKEAIVIADTSVEVVSILNRDYKLGYDESIRCANAIKINFDPNVHKMIYCTNIRR